MAGRSYSSRRRVVTSVGVVDNQGQSPGRSRLAQEEVEMVVWTDASDVGRYMESQYSQGL